MVSTETYRREEVFETTSGHMEMVHRDEYPEMDVRACFLDRHPSGGVGFKQDGLGLYALVSELPLILREPASMQRLIRKNERRGYSEDKGRDTLDDEQPTPTGETGDAAHFEDSNCYQPGECGSADVGCVQDGNSHSDLLLRVE